MSFGYSRSFQKQYKKLPRRVQQRFAQRLTLFAADRSHPQLRMHKLVGKYKGCASINITGDIRAVFQLQSDGMILFVAIGSHSELYE